MDQVAPLPARFTVQTVGGPVVRRLSFSLDRTVSLVSQLTDGEPVPDGVDEALRAAYADVLVVDHGRFAAAWASAADTDALLAEHDRLVKAALGVYAPARIVLLRSAIRRFYWANGSVLPRRYPGDGRDVERLREFVAVLDERFRAATGCVVVPEAAVRLPVRDTPAHDAGLGADAILAIEDAVLAAARAGSSSGVTDELDSGFAAAVQRELLAGPVAPDRVLELLPEDGLDTHEDAAALAAAFTADRDADWSAVAGKAVPSRGVVVEAMRARFESNLRTLRAYPHFYLRPAALDCAPPTGRLVTRLHGCWFLVVDPARPRPIRVRNYGRRGTFDAPGFCDAGYVCRPDQIDAALESWEAYFERGRRGDTAPFRIGFANRTAFRESLEFLDYTEILAGENYCLTIDGNLPAGIDWQPKVDTRFLFDPRTRVCMLSGGIGNQLIRYVDSRSATEQHGLRLFLDDLWFDYPETPDFAAHARADLVGLVSADGVFSDMFSRPLRQRRRIRGHRIYDRTEYAALGLTEQVLVAGGGKIARILADPVSSTALLVVVRSASDFERAVAGPPRGATFIDVIFKGTYIERLLVRDKALWERSINWPRFVSDATAAVADRIRATDSVIVHVRRGDRLSEGIADPDAHYRTFLERAAALDEYPDKQLFVFSDDLDYCRSRSHELGLDLFGEAVTFVEGNRHFASIDDFHLMTLGKVIVCGMSSFSATAAMASARVEYIFGKGYGTDGGDMWRRADIADGRA